MLRFPMHRFARRPNGTCAQVLNALMSREDCGVREFHSVASGEDPKAKRPDAVT
jgi:hypothetical protein